MSTQVLNVTLPEGTLYVSGTVNGTAETWTNTEGNTWQATAPRAEDDIYHVELSIVSSTGSTTTASLTLYYGLVSLITDRTLSDVERVSYLAEKVSAGTATEAEQTEWATDLKGAYNASDLNRAGAAVSYVASRLSGYGYYTDTAPKTDWAVNDVPTAAQMQRYIHDVAELRAALDVSAKTPEAPTTANGLTWAEANNIEQILLDVNELLTLMAAAWFFSGDLYAGEV